MPDDPIICNLSDPPRAHFALHDGPVVHDHILNNGVETGLVILRDMETREPVGFELFGEHKLIRFVQKEAVPFEIEDDS